MPKYPDYFSWNKVRGHVNVSLTIGKDGSVKKHEVIKSNHPVFVKEVEKVIRKWKFHPTVENDVAVEVKTSQTFTFGDPNDVQSIN